MTMAKGKWIGYLSGVGCGIIFGFSWFSMKKILLLSSASVVDVLSIRYLICSLLVLCLILTGKRKISFKYSKKEIGLLFLIGLLQPTMYNILEFSALNYISSSETAILCSLTPLVATVLGAIVLGETTSKKQIFFVFLSMAGVCIINFFDFAPNSSAGIGRAMVVACVLCGAVSRVASRRAHKIFSSFEITSIMMFIPTCVFLSISIITHLLDNSLSEYFALLGNSSIYVYILFLSVGCGFLGFYLNNVCINHLPIAQSSVLALVSTIVAILGGVFLLDENMRWYDILGCTIIIIGITGCNLSRVTAIPSKSKIEK